MNHFERITALQTEMTYCDDQVSCGSCLLHPYCDWCADTKEFTDDELQKLVDIIEHRASADTMQLIRKYNLLKESLRSMCSTDKCEECPYGDQDNCAPCEIITYGMDSENYPELYPYDDKKLTDMVAALEIAKEALETKTKKEMPDYIQSLDYITMGEDEDDNEVISVAEVFDPGLNIIIKCKGQGTYVTIFDGMVCEVPWSIALTTIDAGAEGGLNHDWDNHKVFVYVKEE